jgi:hypothetical protein
VERLSDARVREKSVAWGEKMRDEVGMGGNIWNGDGLCGEVHPCSCRNDGELIHSTPARDTLP